MKRVEKSFTFDHARKRTRSGAVVRLELTWKDHALIPADIDGVDNQTTSWTHDRLWANVGLRRLCEVEECQGLRLQRLLYSALLCVVAGMVQCHLVVDGLRQTVHNSRCDGLNAVTVTMTTTMLLRTVSVSTGGTLYLSIPAVRLPSSSESELSTVDTWIPSDDITIFTVHWPFAFSAPVSFLQNVNICLGINQACVIYQPHAAANNYSIILIINNELYLHAVSSGYYHMTVQMKCNWK